MVEHRIRGWVRKILSEQAVEQLSAPTEKIQGGVRKELRDLKALSESDPNGLMEKLGIKSAQGNTQQERVFGIIEDTVANNDEMGEAYSPPSYAKDKYDRDGVLVSAQGDLQQRDAVLFMRHTIRGARRAGILLDDEKVFIEAIGQNQVLVYPGKSAYTWNVKEESANPPDDQPEPEN